MLNMPGGKTIGCGVHTLKKKEQRTAAAKSITTEKLAEKNAGGKKRQAYHSGMDSHSEHSTKKIARKEYARLERINKARLGISGKGGKYLKGKGGKGTGKGKGGKDSGIKKGRLAAEAVAFWRKQRQEKKAKIRVQTSSGGVCTIGRYCR